MATTDQTTLEAQRAYRDELVDRGLLIPCGVAGVYGRCAELEDTIERVDRLVTAYGAEDRPEVLRFPPLVSRTNFERSEYLKSFPHLAGAIHSFAGDERAHRALLQAADTRDDWSAGFQPTDVVLTPAACHPVYPAVSGTLPDNGRLIDVASYCFRHEPSDDAARLQMFRMHEHVRLTDAESAIAWREVWLHRSERFAASLGIEGRTELASDPFFGRGGTILAQGQREQRLKLEITMPIADRPTAVISLNYHQDHFGSLFAIRTAAGDVAHSACVGFGLERIAFALYWTHGFDRTQWPRRARESLGL